MKTIEDVVLLADSHHGVYIPQLVVQQYLEHPMWDWSEVDQEDIDTVLSGPNDEWYWEAWDSIKDAVKVVDEDGTEYVIVYNEDLWLVPTDVDESEVEQWII
jgi:hypothetical protein